MAAISNINGYPIFSADSYGIDIRDSIVHDLQLAGNLTVQAMTVIDGVIYYQVTNASTDYGYLYSVPTDFSSAPTMLYQQADFHAYSMGSLNKHTLLVTYNGHFMLFDTRTNTPTIKNMSVLWGFCCDRKNDDSSLVPDLFVGFDSCNNGIYRYGHTPNGVFQPSFTIPTAPIGGHLQDTAAYGYWCFELLIGLPGLAGDGDMPYRSNYLHVFNANTANTLCTVPIICNWEIEGISVPNLSSDGTAEMWLADVQGHIYHITSKLQPSSLGAMFEGKLKERPLRRFNANNYKIEAVTDSGGTSKNLITEIYLPHTFPVNAYSNYDLFIINGGSRSRLYAASGLSNLYSVGTNGLYVAYNLVSGTTYTYALASIYNAGSNTNAVYTASSKTLDKTYSTLRISSNSIVPAASEAYDVPDITFA